MGRLRIPGPLGRLLGPLDALLGGEMLVTPLGDFKRLSTLRMRGSQVTGSAGDLELDRNPVQGTPPHRERDPAAQEAFTFKNPTLSLDMSEGALRGASVLSIPSGYGERLSAPLEIPVRLTSTRLNLSRDALHTLSLSGEGNIGIIRGDFKLRIRYDSGQLARIGAHAGRVAASGDKQSEKDPRVTKRDEATKDLLGELKGRSFDFSGVVAPAIPLIGKILKTRMRVWSPDTTRLAHPLMGARESLLPDFLAERATGYRFKYVIPTPAGSLFETPMFGYGYTEAFFGERSGHSFTLAGLPTFSPAAISQGESGWRQFPVYGYLEYYKVWRVSDGLDLGIRFTASASTADLADKKRSEDQYRQLVLDAKDAQYRESDPSANPKDRPAEDKPSGIWLKFEGRF